MAIYIKESLPEPVVRIKGNELELLAPPNHEKPFFVVCWYRPPTSGVDEASFEKLRETLKELDREEKETILIGDTNCDFKSNHNEKAKVLKQIYAEFQFSQMINKYTRVAVTSDERNEQRTMKMLIDHFSTTSPKRILRADALRIEMVDHYMVYGIRKVNAWRLKRKNKKKVVEARSLTKYDKISFINDLRQVD